MIHYDVHIIQKTRIRKYVYDAKYISGKPILDQSLHGGRCPGDLRNHFVYFKLRTLIYTYAIIPTCTGEGLVRKWENPSTKIVPLSSCLRFPLASATADGRYTLALSGQISSAVLGRVYIVQPVAFSV